jgi:predicted DNA-binding ribbon-helix-helix protein
MSGRKRSIAIAGHLTSVSLEDPFWEALREIAAAEGRSVADVVTAVDAARTAGLDRPRQTLSSALRVHVLAYYRGRTGDPDG